MRASELTGADFARIAARSGLSLAYLVGGLVLAILGVVVLSTTVQEILAEDAMQEGVEAFHRREGNAARLLRDLRGDGHPSASVFLAAYEYENARGDSDKLATAVSLFEEALVNEPGRTSAVIGLVSAKLSLAESQGLEPLREAAKDMGDLLEQANDADHPDVVYLKAAVDVLLGKATDAVEVLKADPVEAPSLEGQGARWWNLAVAQLIAHESPLPAAARAYNLRRWPLPPKEGDDAERRLSRRADPERLLRLSFRFALCDPTCKPPEVDALNERVEFGRRLLDQRFKAARTGGRYSPPDVHAREIYNALGVGLSRVDRHRDAVKAFSNAAKGQGTEALYAMNLGVAATLALPSLGKDPNEVKSVKAAAIHAYQGVVRMVGTDKKRLSTLKLAIDNLAAIDYARDPQLGVAILRRYREAYPSEVDWNRNLGALLDWRGQSGCLPHYKKAVELGHPDAVGLKERIALWEKFMLEKRKR